MSGDGTGRNTTLEAAVLVGAATGRFPSLRFGFLAVGMAAAYIAVTGVPTAIIPNRLFHRMTPAGTWNYVSWLLPVALLAASLVPWPQACCVDRRLGARLTTRGRAARIAAHAGAHGVPAGDNLARG